jgi:hypothetical protein
MNTYPISNTRRSQKNKHMGEDFFKRLVDFKVELDTTEKIFSQDRVWPDQCDYILSTFGAYQSTVGNLAESIKLKSYHAGSLAGNRYSALSNLYHFYHQIDKTMSSIREHKLLEQRLSGRKSEFKEIIYTLHQLELSFDDLLKELHNSFEEL